MIYYTLYNRLLANLPCFNGLRFVPFCSWIISSVQSLSRVRLFATPWIAARQASLSITTSWSSLRLMSIESVMPSSPLILCRPLLNPEQYFMVYWYHIFFVPSSVSGHLCCFRVLAIINSASGNIGVHESFWITVFSGSCPGVGLL